MTTAREAPVRISADLYDVQEQFLFDERPYPALIAGRGAGKTHVGCLKDLHYALAHPGAFLVVAAPSFPMLRETTRRTFLGLCPKEIIVRFNQQENLLELAGGSQILFRSLDNPDSVRGLNAAAVHVDEAAFCTSEAWRIIKATVRQPGYPRQAWITSTPKGRNWIWEEWEAQPTAEHVLYRARSSYNPALPADFEGSLGYSGAFYEQEVLGEFVGFEGLVYPSFSRGYVQQAPQRPAASRRTVAGVDFGFRDPAVILVLIDRGDHRYHVAEEWYARAVTIEEHIAAALDMAARWGIERFCADPSRPDSIALMQRAGLPVYGADNDILTGISTVTTLFAERPDGEAGLLIDPSCVNLIAELESYQWPDAKPTRNAGERPLDLNNHAADSLRYACMWLEHAQELVPLSTDLVAAMAGYRGL